MLWLKKYTLFDLVQNLFNHYLQHFVPSLTLGMLVLILYYYYLRKFSGRLYMHLTKPQNHCVDEQCHHTCNLKGGGLQDYILKTHPPIAWGNSIPHEGNQRPLYSFIQPSTTTAQTTNSAPYHPYNIIDLPHRPADNKKPTIIQDGHQRPDLSGKKNPMDKNGLALKWCKSCGKFVHHYARTCTTPCQIPNCTSSHWHPDQQEQEVNFKYFLKMFSLQNE